MRRVWVTNAIFFFVAPFIAAMAIGGIWLALTSVTENFRSGTFSEQIIRAVARAREMRISTKSDPSRAQADFVARLVTNDGMTSVQIDPPSLANGKKGIDGVLNPWGQPIQVFAYPAVQAVRFETRLSQTACRKVLSFYADETASLGLLRVDARTTDPSALWRLVYEVPKKSQVKGGIPLPAIQVGCRGDGDITLSLTFGLK